MITTNTETRNVKFARYIFAIGGAGKSLIYTTLEKDWILHELLKPRYNPTDCDVWIVDTALDEENEDKVRIEGINQKIKEIESKYRNDPHYKDQNDSEKNQMTVGRINLSYVLLTKEMVLQSPTDLVGIGNRVKEAVSGTDIWWINDPALGPDWHKKVVNKANFKEMNFSKGVYRKRAISKAIFYKAITNHLFDIDLLESDKVDIIVGIGGGTGSGIAFDLAKRLKQKHLTNEITLFGILSTLHESHDEKANSFAMLSELEYDRLHGDSVFKDIILIPMEVTQFPGMQRCDDTKKRLLYEFDETFPYILLAYHSNTQSEFLEVPDFAPFIVTTSQMVRYNVEAIKSLKDSVDDSLNSKLESLKNEKIIYDSIAKFINNFYGYTPDQGSTEKLSKDDYAAIIHDRFDRFKFVADHQFFKELEYNSVKYLMSSIKTGISSVPSDDVEAQISSIRSEIDADVTKKSCKDTTDKQLYKVLKNDIETIELLISTLKLVNRIPDKLVVDTLKSVIKLDHENHGRNINKIRNSITTSNSEKNLLERNIKSFQGELLNIQTKQQDIINEQLKKWKDTTSDDKQLISTLGEVESRLNTDYNALIQELNELVMSMNKETNKKLVDAKSTRNIESLLDKIDESLGRIGIYSFQQDKNRITKSLELLKDYKKAEITSKKNISFRVFRPESARIIREAKERAVLKKAELKEHDIFYINETGTIVCGYNYDIQQAITDKKDVLLDSIITKTRNMFSNSPAEVFIQLKDNFQKNSPGIDTEIEEIIKNNLNYEKDILRLKSEIQDKSNELTVVANNLVTLQNLDETITKTIKDNLSKHSEGIGKYYKTIDSIENRVQFMKNSRKEEVRYVMEIQPANIYKATAIGSNINNVLQDGEERAIMKRLLRDASNRTMTSNYNMLVQPVIENEDYTMRWEKTKVVNATISIANIINSAFLNTERDIINRFSLNDQKYSQFVEHFGEPWEVSITLFIAGVPLDNIKSITDSGSGYYKSYNERSKSIFFHHASMLEKGKFIRRKRIFNFEGRTDKQFLLESENEDIVKQFLDNYEEVDIKNSL